MSLAPSRLGHPGSDDRFGGSGIKEYRQKFSNVLIATFIMDWEEDSTR